MTQSKKKAYVVWVGKTPGVYDSWEECRAAVHGFASARYRGFTSKERAEKAYTEGPENYWGKRSPANRDSCAGDEPVAALGGPIIDSICVDAAWNTATKAMEFRGVWHRDRSTMFEYGPCPGGTNNIGEFLAVVSALARLKNESSDLPIYTDSRTAMAWIRNRQVNSASMRKGETSRQVNRLVERATRWLHDNKFGNEIYKWDTETWGDIPADYGRK